jgi:hypothetical protein
MDINTLLNLHEQTTTRCREVMRDKNSDYTGGSQATDALANFKASKSLGLHPVMGLLLRMQDKIQRVRSFVADGSLRVSGETVEDAFDDMINYAILGKALLVEEANETECGISDSEPIVWVGIEEFEPGSFIPPERTVEVMLPGSGRWIRAHYFTPGYEYRELIKP